MTHEPVDWTKRRMWTAEQIMAERAALDKKQYGRWGLAIEQEVRRRVRITIATFAYEVMDDPFMPDAVWDQLAQEINPRLGTCHPMLDEFFAAQFSPMTGMWIHQHPDLPSVRRTYLRAASLRKTR